MHERRAYVILAAISVFFSLATFLSSKAELKSEIKANNHKFCQIIDSAVAIRVQKPPHPNKDRNGEILYERYIRVSQLGRDLGCF